MEVYYPVMIEYPNQPRDNDVVLGNQSSTLGGNAVLGGIGGVKWRLSLEKKPGQPDNLKQRIAALSEAVNYGQSGMDLLIQALEDDSWLIHQTAYVLLEKYSQAKVQQALERYSSRVAKELIKCYEAGERNFNQAKLSGAYLQRVNLSEANFSEANLSEAYLKQAYLSGVNFNKTILKGANLVSTQLFQASLLGANLNQAYLNNADLSQVNLIGANLRGADLSGADLDGADLSQAILTWTNLSEANLSQANLSGTNLVGSNLTGANLSGANLKGAKLKGVNLTDANLMGAYYDNDTDFPVGFGAYSQIIKRQTW